MEFEISYKFYLLPEFNGKVPPKTLVLFSDGAEHQTGFYDGGIIKDHVIYPVNISPKYWAELKNLHGVLSNGYWCVICNRFLESIDGLVVHDDISHPDDFDKYDHINQ